RPHLADVFRLEHPGEPINDLDWLRAAPTLLINARWLPRPGATLDLSGPFVALIDDEVALALVPPELLDYCSPHTLDDCLETWKATLPHRPVGGLLLRHLWEIVDVNGEEIERDFVPSNRAAPVMPAVVGPAERLRVDPMAQLDPLVVANTTGGPV